MTSNQYQYAPQQPPQRATDAEFVVSENVPEDSQEVTGIDFNHHQGSEITVANLVTGMVSMGFQASAVSEAVQIINQMVRRQ